MKYGNGVEVVVGQRVVVIRQGIQSTGKKGIVVAVDDNAVTVHIDERLNPLKFNSLSLELIEPVAKKPEMVEVFVEPEQGDICIYLNMNGQAEMTYFEGRQDFMDVDGNIHFNGRAIPHEQYVGFVAKGNLKFKKPEHNVFPFWCPMSKEEAKIAGFHRMDGAVYLRDTDDVMYHIDWLAAGEIKRKALRAKIVVKGFEEQLDAFRVKRAKEHNNAGLCFGVFWEVNGRLRYDDTAHAACHYSMRSWGRPAGAKEPHSAIQYITSKFYGGRVEDNKKRAGIVDEYLTFVMNNSPWSDYIITKDLDEAKEKGVLVRTNIPANALMCTMYALRYPTEYYDERVKVWHDLVHNFDADPTVAYFLAETEECKRDTRQHHQLLDTFQMGMNELTNFILHGEGEVKCNIYGANGKYDYSNVSIHHCSKNVPDVTAVNHLRNLYKGTIKKEKHPVLGVVKKEIPAIQQIVEHLNELAKNRA